MHKAVPWKRWFNRFAPNPVIYHSTTLHWCQADFTALTAQDRHEHKILKKKKGKALVQNFQVPMTVVDVPVAVAELSSAKSPWNSGDVPLCAPFLGLVQTTAQILSLGLARTLDFNQDISAAITSRTAQS